MTNPLQPIQDTIDTYYQHTGQRPEVLIMHPLMLDTIEVELRDFLILIPDREREDRTGGVACF